MADHYELCPSCNTITRVPKAAGVLVNCKSCFFGWITE